MIRDSCSGVRVGRRNKTSNGGARNEKRQNGHEILSCISHLPTAIRHHGRTPGSHRDIELVHPRHSGKHSSPTDERVNARMFNLVAV